MGLRVTEYLGIPVEKSKKIEPAGAGAKCPFANIECSKISQRTNSKKPVCSVRKPNGRLWIVCRDRLCSSKGADLNQYQKNILHKIAQAVFNTNLELGQIIYKKEVSFKLNGSKKARADYILGVTKDVKIKRNEGYPRKFIIEMQGGGSTSSTGTMTRHIDSWEKNSNRLPNELHIELGIGSIENDSWKRQLDQILIKGHIAVQSGYGFILCVGMALFEYMDTRLNLNQVIMEEGRPDFVILPMIESYNQQTDKIDFTVAEKNIIYTSFHNFTNLITQQGEPQGEQFGGDYLTLDGNRIQED